MARSISSSKIRSRGMPFLFMRRLGIMTLISCSFVILSTHGQNITYDESVIDPIICDANWLTMTYDAQYWLNFTGRSFLLLIRLRAYISFRDFFPRASSGELVVIFYIFRLLSMFILLSLVIKIGFTVNISNIQGINYSNATITLQYSENITIQTIWNWDTSFSLSDIDLPHMIPGYTPFTISTIYDHTGFTAHYSSTESYGLPTKPKRLPVYVKDKFTNDSICCVSQMKGTNSDLITGTCDPSPPPPSPPPPHPPPPNLFQSDAQNFLPSDAVNLTSEQTVYRPVPLLSSPSTVVCLVTNTTGADLCDFIPLSDASMLELDELPSDNPVSNTDTMVGDAITSVAVTSVATSIATSIATSVASSVATTVAATATTTAATTTATTASSFTTTNLFSPGLLNLIASAQLLSMNRYMKMDIGSMLRKTAKDCKLVSFNIDWFSSTLFTSKNIRIYNMGVVYPDTSTQQSRHHHRRFIQTVTPPSSSPPPPPNSSPPSPPLPPPPSQGLNLQVATLAGVSSFDGLVDALNTAILTLGGFTIVLALHFFLINIWKQKLRSVTLPSVLTFPNVELLMLIVCFQPHGQAFGGLLGALFNKDNYTADDSAMQAFYVITIILVSSLYIAILLSSLYVVYHFEEIIYQVCGF